MDLGAVTLTAMLIGGVCAVIGGLIGRSKDRWGWGVALGLLLGPIGLIIVAVMPPGEHASLLPKQAPIVVVPSSTATIDTRPRVPCPQCAELIIADANVCRFCGAALR